MKRAKPNLGNMFNLHTLILVTCVMVVSTLHAHISEGKLQRLHKHHHLNHNHNHNDYRQHNGEANEEAEEAAVDKQQQHHGHHNHHHSQQQELQLQHHHQHQHHHDYEQQHRKPHHIATTPSSELPTSSSSPPSAASVASDNEFLIKQQEQPLLNKDEIYYKTKTDLHLLLESSAATSSTTSKPSLSIHLMKPQDIHNLKAPSTNATSIKHAATFYHSKREHTHQHSNSNSNNNNNSNRLTSTPLVKPEGHGGIDNNHTDDSAKGRESRNSNWNLTSRNDDETANVNEQQTQQQQPYKQSNNDNDKPDFDNEQQQRRQRHQQNYEDYYSDAEDDEIDDDADDDYSEDEGDNDGISYDDNNNLSDRSYARITRSKLDDDYIDDEPYRNGINDLSMQRDAAPGVLTEQKYLDVGNEKAVQQARERYIQEQKRPRTPHELATEHWHRMIQATKCRKPLPRVIPVSNNTSKRYEPYATILHRCGDDTGCCGSTASVCTVKRHEIVMVYVFSYDFNYRKEIEALPMQNHTECHCVNRGSLLHDSMPRDKRSGGSSSYLHNFERQQRYQQQQYRDADAQSYYGQLQFHHQQQLQNMLDCHCPRHFNVFEEDVERHVHLPKPHSVFIRKCRCDCLVNNQTCLRFKHGEEGFSLEDRKCILERNCKLPVCLYGDYNSKVGRCPSYRSHLLQTT